MKEPSDYTEQELDARNQNIEEELVRLQEMEDEESQAEEHPPKNRIFEILVLGLLIVIILSNVFLLFVKIFG
ncbi:hypothetical protein [Edaphobacillus lindanitolerans]|uniref:Uncharacterized protein n=1 Tax=Edaphobacillus lindanitolerans TaxID=550447 RepID=A0A1U7PNE2_9BACI|nr:hypothetical protein [Edaphobacillus lindanitolerans]SIT74590.1 hypothetical protein SAMN05428946_1091 [Edaphobacillus lindanitolerans]